MNGGSESFWNGRAGKRMMGFLYKSRGRFAQSMAVGLVLLAQIFHGCTVNPVSGLPEVSIVSAETEGELGREAAKQVVQTMGITEDPLRSAYLRAIGDRLAKHSPRKDVEYTFYIVEMVEPNAFALPGGYVFVSRGLLALTNSEDELAGVVGHEIGHVAARHAARRITVAAPFAIVSGITGFAVGLVSPSLGRAVSGIARFVGSFVIAPYSRDQEREADSVGVELAARAGWDPRGLSDFLATLGREGELQSGKPRRPSFFETHPATPERVVNTAEQAKKVARGSEGPIAGTRSEFLAKLDGLVVGDDPATGLFQDTRFLQPDLNFAVAFPTGWKTENTPQAVLAAEADGRAFALLEMVGEGDDPVKPAQALEEKLKGKGMGKIEQFTISDLQAARTLVETRTKAGPAALDFTWIAYQGRIYQITGVTKWSNYQTFRSTFAEVARSFRQLQAQEQAGIKVARLRVVSARDGESLEQLSSRTESVWNAQAIAVANGVETSARLQSGQLIKVAIPEPYTTASR